MDIEKLLKESGFAWPRSELAHTFCNNFYAVGSGYGVTEKADFYENAILASAGL